MGPGRFFHGRFAGLARLRGQWLCRPPGGQPALRELLSGHQRGLHPQPLRAEPVLHGLRISRRRLRIQEISLDDLAFALRLPPLIVQLAGLLVGGRRQAAGQPHQRQGAKNPHTSVRRVPPAKCAEESLDRVNRTPSCGRL